MKKQFRLYDIYRYLSVGKQSQIKGIKEYKATKFNSGAITIDVDFVNGVNYSEFYRLRNLQKIL